jgi:2',3'-cyclic-nucleotide 2'-phosphodiesterase (5'-nucleotidase family)
MYFWMKLKNSSPIRLDFASPELWWYQGAGSWPKGDVTVGKIYELMPFDNIMFIVEMKGSHVQELFDKMAESGGWPVSRNVYFEIAYGKAKNIKIKNLALDNEKMYNVALPDYLANGGDNMIFLKGLKTNNTGALIRDMVINHLRDQQAEKYKH